MALRLQSFQSCAHALFSGTAKFNCPQRFRRLSLSHCVSCIIIQDCFSDPVKKRTRSPLIILINPIKDSIDACSLLIPSILLLASQWHWLAEDCAHFLTGLLQLLNKRGLSFRRIAGVILFRKRRLDEVCLERYQQYSRTIIQSWILRGKVLVDGRVINKAGTPVSEKSVVEIKAEIPKYVCRAGYKLEAAIEQLNIDVVGKVALDSGLSTGGFTDCLLQHGASFVYGVDVGYGQVAEKIRCDDRVCVIERRNLRYLSGLPQEVDLVTLDLAFISILLVMPAVVKVMKAESTLVTLVKPQFEAHRSQVGGGGIVRDPLVHLEVLRRIIKGVEEFGFRSKGWIESPIKGAEGNTEFLVCFQRIIVEAA